MSEDLTLLFRKGQRIIASCTTKDHLAMAWRWICALDRYLHWRGIEGRAISKIAISTLQDQYWRKYNACFPI